METANKTCIQEQDRHPTRLLLTIYNQSMICIRRSKRLGSAAPVRRYQTLPSFQTWSSFQTQNTSIKRESRPPEEGHCNTVVSVYNSDFPSASPKSLSWVIINWGKGIYRSFWATLDMRSEWTLSWIPSGPKCYHDTSAAIRKEVR